MATRIIITSFNHSVAGRKARRLVRRALAASRRHTTAELLQVQRDAEIADGLAREQRRLARLQNEMNSALLSTRRTVTRGWKKRRLRIPSTLCGGGGGGTRELRQEIKAVRDEWAAAETVARKKEGGDGGGNDHGNRSGSEGVLLHKNGLSLGGVLESLNCCGGGRSKKGRNMASANVKTRKTTRPLAVGINNSTEQKAQQLANVTVDTGGGGRGNARDTDCSRLNIPAAYDERLGSSQKVVKNTRDSIVIAAATSTDRNKPVGDVGDAAAVEREARSRIMSREVGLTREIIMHDFNARDPPLLQCCAPGCYRTFTCDSHYIEHWAGSSATREESNANGDIGISTTPAAQRATTAVYLPSAEVGHPTLGGEEMARFHLIVANLEGGGENPSGGSRISAGFGFKLVSAYIVRMWGHGQAYNMLLFWGAVESWRRWVSTEPHYLREAINLRRKYLDPDAPREVTLPAETLRGLRCLLDEVTEELVREEDNEVESVRRGGELHEEGLIGEERKEQDQVGKHTNGDLNAAVAALSDQGGRSRESGVGTINGTPDSLAVTTLKETQSPFLAATDPKIHQPSRIKQNVVGHNIERYSNKWPRAANEAARVKDAKTHVIKASTPPKKELLVSSAIARALRPTTFDEAQWLALAHLCRVVGPGFWTADLCRRYNFLRRQKFQKRQETIYEIAKEEVCGERA